MRIFNKFGKVGTCPICGTNEDKDCILIPIVGTEEGNIAECELFHIACLELWYNKENCLIYQKVESKKDRVYPLVVDEE